VRTSIPTVVRDWRYIDLHKWIRKVKGIPEVCVECGKTGKWIEWANISHKYKKDPSDYQAMCRSCHRKYDYNPKPACGNGHLYTPETMVMRFREGRRPNRVCLVCRKNDNNRSKLKRAKV